MNRNGGRIPAQAIRFPIFSTVVLLLVVAGSAVVVRHSISQRRYPAQRVSLSDGSFFTVCDVTFGKTHRVPVAFRWEQLLPGNRVPPYRSEDDSLVIWRSQPDGPAINVERMRIRDSHGCIFDSMSIPTGGRTVVGDCFEVYPRRAAHLALDAYSLSNAPPVAHVTIDNPAPISVPDWQPETLPITRTSDDLTAILRDYRLTPMPGLATNQNGFTVELETRMDGRFAPQWSIDWNSSRVYDVTGNASALSMPRLCPFEKAWRIEAHLYRNVAAKFAPGETWTLKGIAIPGPQQHRTIPQVGSIGASKIVVHAVAGPAIWTLTNGAVTGSQKTTSGGRGVASSLSMSNNTTVETINYGGVLFVVDPITVGPGEHIETWATDGRGRIFEVAMRSGDHYLGFDLPTDVRTVDLHFAITKERIFDFVVAPKITRPDAR